jgi:hypothetical protein
MRKEFRFAMMMILFILFLGHGQVQNAAPDPWVDYASGEYDVFPNIIYSTARNTDLKLNPYQPKDRSIPHLMLMLFHGAKHDGFDRQSLIDSFVSIRESLRRNNILAKE